MLKYFIKRVLLMIPTFLGIILVVFLLLNILPGSNSSAFSSYGDDWLDSVFSALDMHSTIAAKYIRYVYNVIFKFDFGTYSGSIQLGEMLFYRLQYTLKLAVLGFLFSVLIGIPAGMAAAVKQGSGTDKAVSVLTLVLNSVPSYALAVALVVLFCLELGLLPSFGFGSAKYYVIPTIVVSAGGIALLTRVTRSAVIGVLSKQYVTVLRAKGISEGKVLVCHVLRNSMTDIIPSMNNLAAQLLCGTLIAENFFSMPGICQLLINSIGERNQYVVLGCVAVLSVLLMCVNIIADLLNAAVNPQVRMELSGGRRRGNGRRA